MAVTAIATAALLIVGCASERDPLDRGGVHPEGFADLDSAHFHGDALRADGYPLAECRQCHGDDYRGGPVGVDCESAGCHDASRGPVESCSGCHGAAGVAAPPPALDGATASSDPAVGAHVRHLEAGLGDRVGKVVACERCHPVPETALAPGHLDDGPPADVTLPLGGIYDPDTGRCTVWCHFDRAPGPAWTDDSGAARACDACHAFPPERTRIGTPHPPAPPTLSACRECHDFNAATHVDGEVNLL